MSKSRRGKRQNNSLAGWLFADLSLVLALIFMSSKLNFSDSVPPPSTTTTTITTTITTTTTSKIETKKDGVSVNPKVIIVRISNPDKAAQIFDEIKAELKNQGVPEYIKFGVVLIYAGVTDDSQYAEKEAQDRSEKIEKSLKSWGRLTDKRWISGGMHDSSVLYPDVKFKLLEDLSNP